MIKAKRLSGLVLALVIILSITAFTAQAFDAAEFRFTYNAEDTFVLGFDGAELVISCIPQKDAYKYALVVITDTAGYVWIEQEIESQPDGEARISLRSLYSGTYYAELYFYNAASGYYESYAFGDEIKLKWYGTFAEFERPAPLTANSELFSSARTDRTALAYYLKATPYIECDDKIIADKAREITAGYNTDYEKAQALHDWICENIWYDIDLANRGGNMEKSAIETLVSRRAVCSGFTNLYAAFLRSLEIPSKLVYGYGLETLSGGWTDIRLYIDYNHVWNEVFISDRWVIVDTTWDCGNEFENGAVTYSDGLVNHRFFDATLEAFSVNHKIVTTDSHNAIMPAEYDLPSSWAETKVRMAEGLELVPGALRTNYQSQITRAEFCKLAVRLFELVSGGEITGRAEFSDSANVYVEKAAFMGIVNGVGDGRFEPQKKLTREEAAVMLARLSHALGKPLAERNADFSDFGTVSAWAQSAVGQVQAAGIMSGDTESTFSPKSPYTLEQSIITLLRLYDAV